MKAAKWRDLSDDEIRQKARELSEEVFNLRFQLSMGVAKNPSRVNHARKDLARAYTILREKGVAAPSVMSASTLPATASVPAVAAKKPRSAKPAAAAKKPKAARAAAPRAKASKTPKKTKKG
jgi:large subunit ribosomal protein L29